jgi:DNA-binding NarL/FixJ family response regulator
MGRWSLAGEVFIGHDGGVEPDRPDPIRLVIVDDHDVVREGLRALLDAQPDIDVVGDVGTVAKAIERIAALHPDVALVDMQLPDGTGADVCAAVSERSPSTRCVILTSFAHDEALFQAVSAGAVGYVLKQIRSTDLVDCVRRVARGETLLDEEAHANLVRRMRGGESDPKLAALSPQERVLLGHVAAGLTNREIADAMYLAEKTVKNYVSNLLLKLDIPRRSGAAAYAARVEERKDLRMHDVDAGRGPVRY